MNNEHMHEERQPSFWCYRLENCPALKSSQNLELAFILAKVSGSKSMETMKYRPRILKQGSRSLAKSRIYHSILVHNISLRAELLEAWLALTIG